jgi:hypothetical protein
MNNNNKRKYLFDWILEPIRVLVMNSTGKYVASAGDRQIRVFHNIAGEYLIYFNLLYSKFYFRIKRTNWW